MQERFVRITDTTLRDGSHAMAHQFRPEQMVPVAKGLDAAGIPVIEVSHGDGLGGSSLQYGIAAASDEEYLRAVAPVLQRSRLAVLLLPGIGTVEDLRRAREIGAAVARIATHVTEADISEQHMRMAKDMGMEVVGFLMMAHMAPPSVLVEQGKLMESYGADCVYVTDSAGAMTTPEVRERVAALRNALEVRVGFHAHNNLSLGVANSLCAVEEGANDVDGSTCGLGAGAGNTATEVLVAVLSRMGYTTGVDLNRLMDVAEDVVRPFLPRPQVIDRASLVLGYAGVYSSFLLHAYRAADKFGVDARDILVELGRRKVVGGQEDMIVDVAAELAATRTNPSP